MILIGARIVSAQNQAVVADYDTHGNAALSDYRDVFLGTPGISEAMNYTNLHVDLRTAIWQAIDDAHVAGFVADLPDPADLPPDAKAPGEQIGCDFTRTEAINMFAAKVAHAVLLEATNIFPWRLNELNVSDLEGLFKPEELMGVAADYSGIGDDGIWDLEGATPARIRQLVDHSPFRAYAVATARLGGGFTGTQRDAVGAFATEDCGRLYHSNQTNFSTACTVDTIAANTVARNGCHCLARYLLALCRSVNIPGKKLFGWLNNTTHASAEFPHLRLWLNHGDDMIAGKDFQAWPLRVFGDWDQWDTVIRPTPPPDAALVATTERATALWYARLPLWSVLVDNFADPEIGWDAYWFFAEPSLLLAEAQALYRHLRAITGSDGHTSTPPAGWDT